MVRVTATRGPPVTRDSIMVGVDGSRSSSAAIRYAAHEALRSGVGVHLVHVLPSTVPITSMFPLVPLDLEPAGLELLGEGALEASSLLGSERVSTSLLAGPRVPALIDAARHAPMIVIGAEQHSTLERLVTGSTVSGVAAHAECPVVVVPSEWQAQDNQHCVLAGIKTTEHAHDLALRAIRLAADRDAHVLLIHAWEWPDVYAGLVAARLDVPGLAEQARQSIEARIEGLREAHPDIAVELRVVHGQPARVLQRASEGADLVLLARRRHALTPGHLGGTGRALLRESACPVEIVPSTRAMSVGLDLVLEEAGSLRR